MGWCETAKALNCSDAPFTDISCARKSFTWGEQGRINRRNKQGHERGAMPLSRSVCLSVCLSQMPDRERAEKEMPSYPPNPPHGSFEPFLVRQPCSPQKSRIPKMFMGPLLSPNFTTKLINICTTIDGMKDSIGFYICPRTFKTHFTFLGSWNITDKCHEVYLRG